MTNLPTAKRLGQLFNNIFGLDGSEEKLLIISDLPDEKVADDEQWRWLRQAAATFSRLAASPESNLSFKEVKLLTYQNVGNNNGDLPQLFSVTDGQRLTIGFTPQLPAEQKLEFAKLLDDKTIVIAISRFSATAPLKVLAKKYNFRGVTMPGFSKEMLSALDLDYQQVKRRVDKFKTILDKASKLTVNFSAPEKDYCAIFDLRFNPGHSSSGLQTDQGQVGNFPSGEAYIVPFEGKGEEKSQSKGLLPVQFAEEIVVFQLRENRAVKVLSEGEESSKQRAKLISEPAYGNIAEIGLGVLGEFGLKAIGSTLLDEKLGLHIAFGRSDHFGGTVGAKDFKDPANVVHLDWIYVPSIQPLVTVTTATITSEQGRELELMKNGKFLI